MARATMLDLPPEEEQADTIENEVDETQPLPTVAEEQPQEEPQVPEKYRGKTLEEVVQMHQEAEKALGQQGNEVGELRKVVDEYIASQQPAPQPSVEPEDELDYFTDPQAAVNKAIENHPKVRDAELSAAEYRKQAALSRLQEKHPDMQKILQDNAFAEWIRGSNIRTQLFVRADQQYDAEAADELFSLWKERKTVAEQTANVEKQARKNQLKAASTGGGQGVQDGSRKKVYRRADIIKLMKDDPARYTALSDEIMRAYAEGRVK